MRLKLVIRSDGDFREEEVTGAIETLIARFLKEEIAAHGVCVFEVSSDEWLQFEFRDAHPLRLVFTRDGRKAYWSDLNGTSRADLVSAIQSFAAERDGEIENRFPGAVRDLAPRMTEDQIDACFPSASSKQWWKFWGR